MSAPRDARRSRHRSPGPARPVTRPGADDAAFDVAMQHDGDLDTYLAALSSDGETPGGQTGRFGTAQVVQLRLPALRLEQLRRIAQERGVSASALTVDWVIERLDREDTPTGPMTTVAPPDEPRRFGLRRRPRP